MDDLQPGSRIGEYRIEHELGRGGMSVVYAATHLVIGKRAAIKVVHPLLCTDATGMLRAIQEARAINHISHPNVVDVYAYGRLPDGRCYLVMERLDGETLFERMGRRPIEFHECLDILVPMCDALEAAHERGVVHRDVKPANIYLVPVRGRADEVKLLDFGLAKLADHASITQEGAIVGTPDYIAPEQARGGLVDSRADIYSLGVVAFEMLAGRLPFAGPDAPRLLHHHITSEPPHLRDFKRDVPPVLDRLLSAMLAKDPSARPAISEVRRTLHALRHPQRRTGSRLRIAAAALVLLLAAGAVALGARSKTAPPPPQPLLITRVEAAPPAPPPAPKRSSRQHKRTKVRPNDELIYPFN